MKKFSAFCLGVALLLNTTVMTAMATNTIFEYGFDGEIPSAIHIRPSQNIEVVEDDLNPKDNILLIEKNGKEVEGDGDPKMAELYIDFPRQTSTFTVEMDIMYRSGSAWIVIEDEGSWPYGPGTLVDKDGLAGWDGGSIKNLYKETTVQKGTWLRVAVECDVAAKKYRLLYDGEEKFNFKFRNEALTGLSRLYLRVPADVTSGYFYVDNILIYSGAYQGIESSKVNMDAPDPTKDEFKPSQKSDYELIPAPVMAEYYVDASAPAGGTGTKQSPFNTLERAINIVRKANDKMSGDIIVNIADGEYFVENTIQMTQEDNGTNGFNVIYRSETPGGARIYGAKKLSGWTKHTDSIWKVAVDEVPYTIYQDDRRSIKARYPNREFDKDYLTYHGSYLRATGIANDTLRIKVNTDDIKDISFKDITDASICIWPWAHCDWALYTAKIESIDKKEGIIIPNLLADEQYGNKARYYIEGMYELLDTEGEFHYDSDEKMLYYMPYNGEDPNTECSVYAPVVDEIIHMKGKPLTPVENIVFDGISFEKTNFLRSLSIWYHTIDKETLDAIKGLITMDTANNIKMLNCRFKNSGLSGVFITGQSNYNYINNCLFENMGISGVILCGDTEQRNNSEFIRHNRISNCIMHDVGELGIDAAGVNIWSTQGTIAENCEFYNMPRNAFSVRGVCWIGTATLSDNLKVSGRSKENAIRNSLIYEVCQDSGDNGALHTAGVSYQTENGNTNYFDNVFVDNIYAHPTMLDFAPNGYFGDYQSNWQSFKNIKITNHSGADANRATDDFIDVKQTRYGADTKLDTVSFDNVSWFKGFNESKMDYANMGVTDDYPIELAPDYTSVKKAVILQQGAAAAINHGVKTYIDPANHAVQPVNVSDRLLVPIRFIAESFGAEVSWSDPVATVKLGSDVVEITKDSKTIKINGADKEIDVAATILNDRTMVPLRAVAEALGKEVNYYNGLVVVTDEKYLFDEVRDYMTLQRLGNELYYEYDASKFKYDGINHRYDDYVITGTDLKDGEEYIIASAGSINSERYSVKRENGKARLTIKENGYTIPYFREFDLPANKVSFVRQNGFLSVYIDDVQVHSTEFTHDSSVYGTYTANGVNTLTKQNTGLGISNMDPNATPSLITTSDEIALDDNTVTYYLTTADTESNMINLTYHDVKFESSNPSVARAENGYIIPVSIGSATLTCNVVINGVPQSLSTTVNIVEKTDILTKSDFNMGMLSLAGWEITTIDGSQILVNDNKLEIRAKSSKDMDLKRTFKPYSGKFQVECEYTAIYDPSNPGGGGAPIYIQGTEGWAICLFSYDGQLAYYDGGVKILEGVEHKSGQTYKFKLIGDTETHKYDVYVDGKLIMDDFNFRTPVSSITGVRFGCAGAPKNVTLQWDNIVVKAIN